MNNLADVTGLPAAANVPAQSQPDCRILEVFGNSMLPLYRHGDRLIISLDALVMAGDRVAALLAGGETIAGSLLHRSKSKLVIARGGHSGRAAEFLADDIEWFGRILWASQ